LLYNASAKGGKQMKRYSFTALLCLIMTLLAACGQQGTGSGTTGTQASPAATTSASAPASSTAVEETGAASGGLPNLNGRKVVIGTDATYPPMESVDRQTNQIVGFDVDMMNEVAKLINIQPEFQNAAFDTIFTALQSKQFDAVVSSATITDERKKIVAFSEPYIEVGQVVVVRSDSQITGAQDLANGAVVGVQTGTTGEEAAKTDAKVADNNLKRYQTIDLAFAELANNTVDAVVADSPTVANYVSQEQYKDKLKVVGEPFTTENYGIAVHQEDTELLNAINAAIEELKANGTIDQLKQKYNIK
jgi:polar amino acid transport system substrate-binding protein